MLHMNQLLLLLIQFVESFSFFFPQGFKPGKYGSIHDLVQLVFPGNKNVSPTAQKQVNEVVFNYFTHFSDAKKSPLSEIEAGAITYYTGDLYSDINFFLYHPQFGRCFDLNAFVLDFLWCLIGGISKLPVEDKIRVVTRKIRNSLLTPYYVGQKCFETQYVPSSNVIWITLTSTSANPDLPFFGCNKLIIHHKSGRNISLLSLHPEEEEIVLLPNIVLKVLSTRLDEGHEEIELEEIHEDDILEIVTEIIDREVPDSDPIDSLCKYDLNI